jgi:hypothetical protein
MTKFTVYLRIKTEDNAVKSQKLEWECSSTEEALHYAIDIFESREVVGMTICKGSKIVMTLDNGGAESRKSRRPNLKRRIGGEA